MGLDANAGRQRRNMVERFFRIGADGASWLVHRAGARSRLGRRRLAQRNHFWATRLAFGPARRGYCARRGLCSGEPGLHDLTELQPARQQQRPLVLPFVGVHRNGLGRRRRANFSGRWSDLVVPALRQPHAPHPVEDEPLLAVLRRGDLRRVHSLRRLPHPVTDL